MIDFVKGRIAYNGPDSVTVETNGIGYQIFIPTDLSFQQGKEVLLYTHFVPREEAHMLYGFPTMEERDLFRLLLAVSGIGPKAAISILSNGNPEQVVRAIQIEDLQFFKKVPGIGKKTAQRLFIELKDKLKNWTNESNVDLAPRQKPIDHEAIEALIALGYHEGEAEEAVKWVLQANDGALSTEALIKKALQFSMKR